MHSTQYFLKRLNDQRPDIRVLLDVGAQMLELRNDELLRMWLEQRQDIPPGLFFDDAGDLVVRTQDGTIEPFISSPYRQQLDKCIVYLDDVHIRGTDLKLPRNTRAAVTLGAKVTKDRLVQGCMRMRKLGDGQSVMFFTPQDIDRKIREVASNPLDKVEVSDILQWSMLETYKDIEHHLPQWAQQEYQYEKRSRAWEQIWNQSESINDTLIGLLKSAWLQKESRTLEEMYGSHPDADHQLDLPFSIPALRERCKKLGWTSLRGTRLDEEQEREVSHEVEQERQVERPPKTKAAVHQVHRFVRDLACTGILNHDSAAFVLVSVILEHAITPQDYSVWSSRLYATRDFATTIEGSFSSASDYLRPINWILSNNSLDDLVILSPYEVNELLPKIRRSKTVHLHIYAPRIAESMRSFDDLMFHCIPSLSPSWAARNGETIIQLNLWAGQLYLKDYGEYLRVTRFLGIYSEEN
ncbi:hypothetical protein AcW1_002063 [Taiwanofungus camphoratus]|nr:hypothetical protein AcW1_002063 [Antrodia cinnamomea]KAI0945967.1 hypothetical protein AcV7_010069 [Antrodia cinnamomea]